VKKMSTKFGKKLIAAQSNLVQKIARIAKIKGITVYSFVNEIMEQAIQAEEIGRSLKEVVELHKLTEIEKQTGAVLIPREILNILIQKVFEEDSKSLTDMFYKTGEWLGKYCKVRFSGENQLRAIEKMVKSMFGEITRFGITKKSDEILVQCIGSRIPNSYTTLLSTFIEGIMHTFEYSTIKKDMSKGIISLKFR
jgi:hypothetical protein